MLHKSCLCWFVFFAQLKALWFKDSCGKRPRTADTPSYGINYPLMPLPLDPVHKNNGLVPFYAILNGTVTSVNDFRTGSGHRKRHYTKNGYSVWSDWSSCNPEKCTVVRRRHCVRSEICGSNVVTESSYCFTEGSRCLGLVTNYGPGSGWSPPNKGNRRASVNFTCGVTADSTSTAHKTPRYLIRIMGGRESERYRWPWQVAVFNGFKELICGGTLVAPGWVLTAAHCSRKKLSVRLGEHDLSVNDGDEIDVRVDRVIVHPRFNPSTIDNDIALLKLHALDLRTNRGNGLQPACLPVSNFQGRKRKPTMCLVIGWGKVRSKDPYGSPVLQEARVPIVGQRACRAAYRRYLITDNMFCAGHKDGRSDTCSGDSGGPLLCRMRGRWTVAGVTSFGDGCGRRGKYGIYASVANHVPWIGSVIASTASDSAGSKRAMYGVGSERLAGQRRA